MSSKSGSLAQGNSYAAKRYGNFREEWKGVKLKKNQAHEGNVFFCQGQDQPRHGGYEVLLNYENVVRCFDQAS